MAFTVLSLLVPPKLPVPVLDAINSVLGSMAVVIVYAFTLADIDETSAREAWLRAFERAWVVILLDFLQTAALYKGEQLTAASELGGVLAGILFMCSLGINFADIDAVVTDDDRWWMLAPAAIFRSITTTWSGVPVMLRATTLFLLQFFPGVIAGPVWVRIVASGLLLVPLSVLTTHVYLDAIGYESKHTCSE